MYVPLSGWIFIFAIVLGRTAQLWRRDRIDLQMACSKSPYTKIAPFEGSTTGCNRIRSKGRTHTWEAAAVGEANN